jgi:hypothetical protein
VKGMMRTMPFVVAIAVVIIVTQILVLVCLYYITHCCKFIQDTT